MKHLLVLLAVLSLAVACDGETPTPCPTPVSTPNCDATLWPLETRVAEMDVVLSEIEVFVAELAPMCEARLTETPMATETPIATPVPVETPTPVAEFVYVVLGNAQDTYLYAYAPTADFAAAGVVKLGEKDRNRALYHFDMDGVPPMADIARATLKLWVYSWSAAPITATAYALYRPFEAATWNNATAGVPWVVAGCGGSGTDRDEEATSINRLYGIKSWVEVDLTAAVRRWITYLPNYGVVLYSEGNVSYQFIAAESADVAHRPILEVLCRNPSWE